MNAIDENNYLIFIVIISDTLSKYLIASLNTNCVSLLLISYRDISRIATFTMSKRGWRWRIMRRVTSGWGCRKFIPRTIRRKMATYVRMRDMGINREEG